MLNQNHSISYDPYIHLDCSIDAFRDRIKNHNIHRYKVATVKSSSRLSPNKFMETSYDNVKRFK